MQKQADKRAKGRDRAKIWTRMLNRTDRQTKGMDNEQTQKIGNVRNNDKKRKGKR